MKVKKGDLVQMLAGKDRGKQGRVLDARPSERKVVVENLNVARRHQKPRPIRDANRMGGTQVAPGGIIDKPTPVPVGNVMTRDVICCGLDDDLDEVSAIMKSHRVRHVPVCERDGRLRGIVSIGDVNAQYASNAEQTIHFLNDYIYGRV